MAVSRAGSNTNSNKPMPPESLSMKDKVVAITGAERGIGRDVAIVFARAGARLVLNYLRVKSDINETVRLVHGAGAECVIVRGDISQRKTSKEIVISAYKAFGRLNAVVNNAGIHLYKRLEDISEMDWETQLAINLKGPFLLSQEAVKAWRHHKMRGRIVNITSCGSRMPFPCSAAYNASKYGLLGLTQQLALDLAPENIRVNAVAPGVVHTSINDQLLRQPAWLRAWESVVPAGMIGEAEDVAHAVLFLCSDASEYITGQQLAVDGAWSINPVWGVAPYSTRPMTKKRKTE